jgi:hypothetical protein
MPAHRLPDSEKRARGTYDPRYAESAVVHGRTSIVQPLPPPSELDAAAKKHVMTRHKPGSPLALR